MQAERFMQLSRSDANVKKQTQMQLQETKVREEKFGMVPAHSIGHILADFNGKEYGPDYLTLASGDLVSLCPSPDLNAEGWSFGIHVKDGSSGWFPSQFWASGPPRSFEPPSQSREHGDKTYDKAFLVSVRHMVGSDPEGNVPSTMCETKIRAAVSRQKKQPDSLQSMILLLEAAGGSVRLGNLAAACIALSIMSGTHKQVYLDVLELVQKSPELFEPLDSSQKSLRQILISLAGFGVMGAPGLIPEVDDMGQSDRPSISEMHIPFSMGV
mmetsp:Transcript_14416/g.27009  ORF Transcript_14416/g.27009 Transcript_14416/m.27009 type:complete len:270 (+) Transcript_14416:84-893(+)